MKDRKHKLWIKKNGKKVYMSEEKVLAWLRKRVKKTIEEPEEEKTYMDITNDIY